MKRTVKRVVLSTKTETLTYTLRELEALVRADEKLGADVRCDLYIMGSGAEMFADDEVNFQFVSQTADEEEG